MAKRSSRDGVLDVETRGKRHATIGAIVVVAALVLTGVGLWVDSNRGQSADDSATTDSTVAVYRDLSRTQVVAAFVGDSWTGGSDMGGRGDRNWSALLSDQLGWQDFNFGVGGTGYVDDGGKKDRFWSAARTSAVTRQKPDVVVISNGINDLDDVPVDYMPRRLDEIAAGADSTYSAYREFLPNTTIVVMGYTPPGDSTELIREVNRRLELSAQAHGMPFINPTAPDHEWFSGVHKPLIGQDRYHPTDEGHAYYAGVLLPIFEQIGARDFPQIYTEWGTTAEPLPNSFVK